MQKNKITYKINPDYNKSGFLFLKIYTYMSEVQKPREITFEGISTDVHEIKNTIDQYFTKLKKSGFWSDADSEKSWEWFSDKYQKAIDREHGPDKNDKQKITPEYKTQITTELLAEMRVLSEGVVQERKESLSPELLNRYGAEKEFLRRTAKAKKEGRVVVLVTFDLDGFKTINDTINHGAGDTLLRELAKNLSTSIRPEDIGIRFSGDEFGVLMSVPKEEKDNIQTFVERIIQKVENGTERPDNTKQEMSTGYIVIENDDPDNKDFFKETRKKADKGSELSKLIKIVQIIKGETTTSKDRVVSSDNMEDYFEEEEKARLSYIRQVMRPMREVLKDKSEKEIVGYALQCYEKLVEKK